MTILNEHVQWFPFVFAGFAVWLMTILAISFAAANVIEYFRKFDPHNFIMAMLTGFLAALLLVAFVVGLNHGPDVYVTATVTDWNEVYEAGYELIDQQGEIYTLKEERP